MKLNLTQPIIFFDIEATGLNVVKDRIVELCYIKVHPCGTEEGQTLRFNPGIPISSEATAINHITNADVADCPSFKEKAAELAAVFQECDLAGYNSNQYDVPILVEEFARSGIDFNVHQCRLIDVQNIYHKMEPRTLSAAYKFYCHEELQNAHTADADTRATYEILKAQLAHYDGTLQNDTDWLADFSKRNNNIDLAGRFVFSDTNEVLVNFGKHKGRPLASVLRTDPSFYGWVMQGDFSQDTKRTLTRLRLNTGL